MIKQMFKKKSVIALLIFIGVLSFSVCHASTMHQSVDEMDCHAQTLCQACPVPVILASPDLSNVLIPIEIVSEKSSYLPDPPNHPFYHPPQIKLPFPLFSDLKNIAYLG
jgi:hypothetical protein